MTQSHNLTTLLYLKSNIIKSSHTITIFKTMLLGGKFQQYF